MLKLPAESGRTWGRHGRPYADFALLRYPVYLPIVRELAEKGDARGLEALGAMAFPQATAALLDLANHQDRAIASKAEELLLDRMPFVVLDGALRASVIWPSAPRRVDLQDRALQIGWRLLAQPDREGRIRGGRIIQILGGRDDLPKLIDAMDKLLRAYQDDDTEQRAWLRPATVSETLSEAAADLIRRGARPPATAGTPGQAAAFLAGLKASKDFRPAGWQGTTASLLKHDIPFLRRAGAGRHAFAARRCGCRAGGRPYPGSVPARAGFRLRPGPPVETGPLPPAADGRGAERYQRLGVAERSFTPPPPAGPTWTACWRSSWTGWNRIAATGTWCC